MKKNIFTIALAVVFAAVCMVSCGNKKEEKGAAGYKPAKIVDEGVCGEEGGNLTWTLDANGVLFITGEGEMYSDWVSDVERAPWDYAAETQIKEIIIDKGVTTISKYAFWNCQAVEKVTVSNTVTEIEACAFHKTPSLKVIEIPSSVTYIAYNAFSYDGNDERPEVTVKGKEGSAAYRAAEDNGMNFEAV